MLRQTAKFIPSPVKTRSQIANIVVRGLSTNSSSEQFIVKHDSKNNKFMIQLDPDNSAFIDYEQLNNNEVLLYHTEVPKIYGGKGIGQLLANEAFNHFDKSGQKMVITCTYLQKLYSNRKEN
ncbi:Protein natd1 [Blomia tropicalis]|nr:Protein natd1 [Blomia tropicalis]